MFEDPLLLNVEEADRVDFDEALLPEDSWKGDLEEGEFEVEKIIDVRSGQTTRYGEAIGKFGVGRFKMLCQSKNAAL